MDNDKSLVLIVDDETIYLKLLGDLLKHEYRLRLALNNLEGLQKSCIN